MIVWNDGEFAIASGQFRLKKHRRFEAGWRNFNSKYKLLVDAWALYDNSQRQAVLIEEGVNDKDKYSG
jgi:hypothetical protein